MIAKSIAATNRSDEVSNILDSSSFKTNDDDDYDDASGSARSPVSGKNDMKDDFCIFSSSLSKLGYANLKVSKIEADERRMEHLHETKMKLVDDIKELRKEQHQLTMKLS